MKKRNRTVEKASLPQALEKHLAVYALAAGAAGVSALALAPSAQASSFTLSLLALGAAGLFVLRKRKLAAR
jgi:hypothetical protein